MSGHKLRVVLDTNAVVALLAGNMDLALRLESAEYVGISVVTYLEFLAFNSLSEHCCIARPRLSPSLPPQ